MSRLIVKNLPQKTSEKALRDLFGQKGTVTDCSLKYKDGQFRKFAFIGFSSDEEAAAAQQYFDKTFVQTSRILVEMAFELGQPKPKPWSKHTKAVEPVETETTKKKKKAELKKKKEAEKDAALLGELHNDPEFKEYLAAYNPKDRKTWGNDAIQESEGPGKDKDSDGSEDDEGDDDEKEKEEVDKKETDPMEEKDESQEKGAKGKVSDLDFLKSKMADSALLSSEDESDDEDSSKSKSLKSKRKKNLESGEDSKASDKTAAGKETKEPKDQKEPATPRQKFCLKMKGLSTTTKEGPVREFFKPLKVKIRLPTNKNKMSIGIAFIECRNEKELEAALAKNKSFIGKKKVFLKRIEDLPAPPKLEEKPRPWENKADNLEQEESIAESGRLFVRNLAYQCTEDNLEPLFKKYGPIVDFDLPVDGTTKKIKGFAHVTYMMTEHAVKAYTDLDGMSFMGRMLHILPGKDREEKYTSNEKSSYKKLKDEKNKALAKSSHNWNSLFISSNAVATAMATKYQTDKSDILDDSGKGSLGVRMALGETQLVQETRQFLLDQGVALDSFSQADGERSKTVIIAKDLPAETAEAELREVFEKYGTLTSVVLPPHGFTALLRFQEPSEARKAFTKLAYRRFKYLPLYLEWAPMGVFSKDAPGTSAGSKDVDMDNTEEAEPKGIDTIEKKEDSGVASESEEESEPGSTVFVKNLNFDTQEAALLELFASAGAVARVTIAKKKDMKNPGQFLSMGYGFVEYKKAASAMESLKTLQKKTLDGHTLELKISHRETLQSNTGRKKQSGSQKGSTKILIRNIPFQCNKREVEELFKVFGELKYVRVPKKSSGPGIQGFGFVDFLTKQDAKRAFDALCHSTHLYGRRLVLEWANTVETVEDLQRKTAQKFFDGGPAKKLRKKAIMDSLE